MGYTAVTIAQQYVRRQAKREDYNRPLGTKHRKNFEVVVTGYWGWLVFSKSRVQGVTV